MKAEAEKNLARHIGPPSELPFSVLCRLFEFLKTTKSNKKRHDRIKEFIDRIIRKETGEAFEVFRLILPRLDMERGDYNLLDKKLLTVLMLAANIGKSEAAGLRGWKQFTSGAAGNFSQAVEEKIFQNHCFYRNDTPNEKRYQIRVKEINKILDDLAKAARDTKEQAKIIRGCFSKMTPLEMRWLTDTVLKNMKIGVSEKTIFKEWHPDAQEVYNNSGMSLRTVFNEMIDEYKPWRFDIKPGAPIRPQLACAALDAETAFERMHKSQKDGGGLRPFIVETKFDGERMQVHRCKDGKIYYFSRKAIDHGERGYSIINNALLAATGSHQEIILDGELLVWNKVRRVFEPFGGIKSVVNAFRENLSPDTILFLDEYGGVSADGTSNVDYTPPKFGDLELWYIAFDILYVDGQSLIAKPLKERQKILAEALTETEPAPDAWNRRVVPLIPERTMFNGALASRTASTAEEIKTALESAERMREEGIIVKALDSYWIPDDRSSSWQKCKPDYVRALEIDAVVLGGYYATGKRGGSGGKLSQWLMGVRSTAPKECDEPQGWVTYCRVGTGLSDQQNDQLNEQLRPFLVSSLGPDGKYIDRKPACVKATGIEKPDVWVNDISKSVVFEIRADVRSIKTITYATGLSLRFPRVDSISPKGPADASTEEEVYDYVQQKKEKLKREMAAKEEDAAGGGNDKKRKGKGRARGGSKRVKKVGLVAAAFKSAELSHVAQENTALAGCNIRFLTKEMELPTPLDDGTKKLKYENAAALLKRMGGVDWLSEDPAVTHTIAGVGSKEEGFIKREAARDKDVISIAWLLRCAEQDQLALLRPKDYLAASSATRSAIRRAHLTAAIDGEDLGAMLNLMPLENVDRRGLQERLVQYFGDSFKGAPGGIPSPRAHVLPFIDRLLAQRGLLDYKVSILHGYTLVFVALGGAEAASYSLPPTGVLTMAKTCWSTAAAVSATSKRLEMERIALTARAHGASVVRDVGYEVTHVVGIQFAPSNGAGHSDHMLSTAGVSPAVLLAAIRDQAGGAAGIAALEKGLKAGNLKIASQAWLEECYAVADAASLPACALSLERGSSRPPPPQQVDVPDAAEYPLMETGAHSFSYDAWPWHEFGPAPVPSPKHIPKPSPPRPVRAPRRRGNATKIKKPTAAARPLPPTLTVKDEDQVQEEEVKEEPLSFEMGDVPAMPAVPLSEAPHTCAPTLMSVPVVPAAADGAASEIGGGGGSAAVGPPQDPKPKLSLRERANRLGI